MSDKRDQASKAWLRDEILAVVKTAKLSVRDSAEILLDLARALPGRAAEERGHSSSVVCLGDVPLDKELVRAAEAGYRRGAYQTASCVANRVDRLKRIGEARRFLTLFTNALGELRGDRDPHPSLLDEVERLALRALDKTSHN